MITPTNLESIQDVIDRLAIIEKVCLYAGAMDRRDWDLYRTIFADRVEISFPASTPAAEDGPRAAEEWVSLVYRTLTAFEHTHHMITNHIVTIDGDWATCQSHMVARHYDKSPDVETGWIIGGFYTHSLSKLSAEWKICGVKLHDTWEQGADVRDRVLAG